MAREKEYAKLAGPGLMAYQRLYEGKDHFLVIDGIYSETYRRLFYKDVEALIYCPTKAGTITIWISGLALLVSLLGFAATMSSGSAIVGMWIFFCIISAPVFILSAIAGGTCSFAIKTSAQIIQLRNVSGRRRARKLMRKVTEIVEGVQGQLTQETLDDAFIKARTQNTPVAPAQSISGSPPIL